MGSTNSKTNENEEKSFNTSSEAAAEVVKVEKVQPEIEKGVQIQKDGDTIDMKSRSQVIVEQIRALLDERKTLLKDRMENEKIIREKEIQLNEQTEIIALQKHVLGQFETSKLEKIKSRPMKPPTKERKKINDQIDMDKKSSNRVSQTESGFGVIRKSASNRRSYSFKGIVRSSCKTAENSYDSAEPQKPHLQNPRRSVNVRIPPCTEKSIHQFNEKLSNLDLGSEKKTNTHGNGGAFRNKFTKYSKNDESRERNMDTNQKLSFTFDIFPTTSTQFRRNTWNGGQRRTTAEFRCPRCDRGRTSANSFIGVTQQCEKCLIDVSPSKPEEKSKKFRIFRNSARYSWKNTSKIVKDDKKSEDIYRCD